MCKKPLIAALLIFFFFSSVLTSQALELDYYSRAVMVEHMKDTGDIHLLTEYLNAIIETAEAGGKGIEGINLDYYIDELNTFLFALGFSDEDLDYLFETYVFQENVLPAEKLLPLESIIGELDFDTIEPPIKNPQGINASDHVHPYLGLGFCTIILPIKIFFTLIIMVFTSADLWYLLEELFWFMIGCLGLHIDICPDYDDDGWSRWGFCNHSGRKDCNDADPTIYPGWPGAPECPDGSGDGIDNNCNGEVDEDCKDETTTTTTTISSTSTTTIPLVWEYKTGPCSSPTVSGGYVYVGSDYDKVYCLDAATGTKVWEYQTGADISSSPAVSEGYVFVGGDDDKVYCLDAVTGSKVWEYQTGADITSSPAVSEGYVFVGSYDYKVYCLDAVTGSKVWEYQTGSLIYSSPAVSESYVFVGSGDNKVYCLDAVTGSKVWEYQTGDSVSTSSPAVSGSYVYVGSYDHKVYCLDADTGSKIWEYETGDRVRPSPAVSGGYVYVGSYDHKVYCLDADTGSKVWEYETGAYINSPPAVSGDYVYIRSMNRKLYCLDADTGSKIWEYETGGYSINSSPAISDGYVYVGTDKVSCLKAAEGDTGSWPMFKYNAARTGAK